MCCSLLNHENIVKALLEKGANANKKSGRGITPLIVATHKRYPAIVKLLLAHGADKKGTDNEGRTAMDYANHFGYTEIAAILR